MGLLILFLERRIACLSVVNTKIIIGSRLILGLKEKGLSTKFVDSLSHVVILYLLFRAEDAISSVAKARKDVLALVHALINRG